MSLINRLAQESIKQNKLISQLSEISYRAINGKRQSARNFNEGTLNVGTMNFNTPPDKITKDMFMDYQKTEQQKHYTDGTNKFQYDPTGLFDPTGTATIPLAQPTSIPLPGKTTEATEQDVLDETKQWRILHQDLEDYKTEIRNKKEKITELYDKKSQAENQIDINNEEIKRIENRIIPIDANIAIIDANLVRFRATATGTAGRMARINAELAKKRSEEAKKLPLVTEKTKLETEVTNLGADIITIEGFITTGETDINDIQFTDIPAKIKDIEAQDIIVGQVKENVKLNKVEVLKANNLNRPIIKQYEDTFNTLNRNRYSVSQEPNESDDAYLKRIQSLETNTYNPDIFKDKASNEENKKFMTNLRNVVRDEVKISDIVKSFNGKPEEVYIINNNWKEIEEQLKKKFGPNNPRTPFAEYTKEIEDVIDNLVHKQYGTTLIPTNTATSATSLCNATAPVGTPTVLNNTGGAVTDFESIVENGALYINNKRLGKAIWVRLAKHSSKEFIAFSNGDNIEGAFRTFVHTSGFSNFHFNRILDILDLNANTEVKDQLFGPVYNVTPMIAFLKSTAIGLPVVTGKIITDNGGVFMKGWGMKHDEEVPKLANFGKNIILLNKLYYKNILSVKDKKMHSVEHMPNVKVSDTLADIIFNMCKNANANKPTKETLDTLKSSERVLFDLLLYVSGLSKSKSISTISGNSKDKHIKELKERLKLVEAEIQAGNNNPVVKAELKDIVNKLVLYHVISQNNGKEYLQQF
jgi:hypothetical protein